MALTIPNLDRITKANVPTGEAFKKIQDYTAKNLAQAAGNAVAAPPVAATPPASQTLAPITTPVASIPAPPLNGGPPLVQS